MKKVGSLVFYDSLEEKSKAPRQKKVKKVADKKPTKPKGDTLFYLEGRAVRPSYINQDEKYLLAVDKQKELFDVSKLKEDSLVDVFVSFYKVGTLKVSKICRYRHKVYFRIHERVPGTSNCFSGRTAVGFDRFNAGTEYGDVYRIKEDS